MKALVVNLNGNKLVAFDTTEDMEYFLLGVDRFYPMAYSKMIEDFGCIDRSDYRAITRIGDKWQVVPDVNYETLVALTMLGNTPWKRVKWEKEETSVCMGYCDMIGILGNL
jgi:hypothetical protein